jgi:hypothetical protein
MVNNELQNAHTLLGEVTIESFSVGARGTWTPAMLIAVDEAFFDGEIATSVKFYPPRRVALEPNHITAMVEHSDVPVRPVS